MQVRECNQSVMNKTTLHEFLIQKIGLREHTSLMNAPTPVTQNNTYKSGH
jgi:hypothetical protein